VCVVTNVRMSYIQALAAQQTLELRQNLSKLADNAVETSKHRYLCRMNE
jgi:outer membrane protein TolC